MTDRNFSKPIVILGPMESESAMLIQALEEKREEKNGAYVFNKGYIDGYPVVVCRCYIGVVNSAAATALAIQKYDPLCVIIQGTSGAHDPNLHQGDIVLGEKTVNIGCYFAAHRDKDQGSAPFEREFFGTEIVTENGLEEIKYLYGDKRIIDAASDIPYEYGKVVRGTIGAADIWNRELDMIDHLHRTLGTSCEEMEGFGVAQVCAQLGIPCADIRIISNSEWYQDERFDENYGGFCQMFVLEVIRKIIADKALV